MKRTRETAKYVSDALGLDTKFDDRIREVGNSYHDGQPIAEDVLPRAYNDKQRSSPFSSTVTDIENGESWMHFRIRVGQFIDDIYKQHKGQMVYVVAHGGVMAALFDLVFNVGIYRHCGVNTENTGWTRFEYHPGESFTDWIMHEHNRVDHLVQAGLL